jgi:AcrR family transcriptional regulator
MPITNTASTRRSYSSPLREQQAAATRERILGGLVKTMADGLAEVSMPAVARAAGVSVATVYRHFPSKQALFDAMPGYIARRTGTGDLHRPRSFAELSETIRTVYDNVERVDDVLRAAMDSPLGDVARRAQMPARLRFIEDTIEALAPGLPEPAHSRIARLLLVLTSSSAQRMLSAAGLSAREAADDATWAIQSLIEAETAST